MIDWKASGLADGQDYTDIRYETAEGIAKITINRPEVRNAFRPTTLFELSHAFNVARDDSEIGVIILTGAGDKAFCSGGDQRVRGDDGYKDTRGVGRLNVLDLQVQIRRTPKPVIAMVAGYAIGGGHVLHVCCDLTIAADNAIFGQTGPKVGSFDGGYGSSLLAATVGLKKAREIWYLCRQYSAREALEMGLVNTVVPLDAARRRDGELGTRDARQVAAGAAHAQGRAQCVHRRRRRPAAVRRRRDDAVLHERGGAGRPGRLREQARARFQQVPAPAVTGAAMPRIDAGLAAELLPTLRAFAIPMPTRFRGVTLREGALLHGPAGWGEFSPFAEYGPRECARWLSCALESAACGWPSPARDSVPVNVTVPAVGAEQAYKIVAESGCRTAKVKVAERGQTDADDIERVAAVRDAIGPDGKVRVDANGGWTVGQAQRQLAALSRGRPGVRRAAVRHTRRAGRTAPPGGRAAGGGRVDPPGRRPAQSARCRSR